MKFKALLQGAALSFGLMAGAQSALAATEMLDQVVAIVDDDVIMASELRERLAIVTEGMQARGMELPAEDQLIRDTLDRLILESIQMQMGNRVGVRIPDAQLDAAMGRIASQNRMSLDQFKVALEGEGRSYPAMREQIRRELVVQRVQQGNVNREVEISDQEIDNFMATEEGQKMIQPEYRILQALLPVSPGEDAASVAAKEAYIDKLLAEVRAGGDYEAAVSRTDPYTLGGGDLGWRKLDDLPSMFTEIAPTLERGEVGKVQSASGFHLVLMAGTRGGEQMVKQTKARHILLQTSEIQTDEQARELAVELKQRALDGEDFAELAKTYSDDIGSASERGDLGWTNPGQMVPEFENTMDSTEIGQISDPVRSQFGWHIIEVLDRRDEDMTELSKRARIREFLHGRKYQEELDAWLRKIRAEAFVDIK